jgi:hypothetical protein
MRIVLVHGRAGQMDIPPTMERDWEDALRYGLTRIEPMAAPPTLDVKLAFYGDIWRPDYQQPMPVIEPVPEFALPGVSDVSLWLDEHVGAGDTLLDLLLRDVESYFTEPDLRQKTNATLIKAVTLGLPAGEKAIVVGFSMGSLVAYETLRSDPSLPVGALITIGSPLAMPSFYRHVEASGPPPPAAPTPLPSQLAMWVNIWTKDDPGTAGHVQMATRYAAVPPSTVRVQDLETWGRPASPTNPTGAHNAVDYLSSRVFATALQAALGRVGA